MYRFLFSLAMMFCLLWTGPQWANCQNQQQILIGIAPEYNVFEQHKKFKALASYLYAETDIVVNITSFASYGDFIDSFITNKIDGAFFGTFAGLIAHELGAEALVRSVTPTGKNTYNSHIFVKKDSGIKRVSDMKGKVIALVDRASASGYLFPLSYLRQNGINDMEDFFDEVFFTGSHDAAISLVLEGRADLGVAKSTIYDALKSKDPRVEQELTILVESRELPTNILFLNKNIAPEITAKIKKGLIEMDKSSHGKKVLEKFGTLRFLPQESHTPYANAYKIIEETGVNICEGNYHSHYHKNIISHPGC